MKTTSKAMLQATRGQPCLVREEDESNSSSSATVGNQLSTKSATGIIGLDAMTGGGLPRGRATVVMGGPGSGKTIFALEFLAQGARELDEPGIFVAFEESSDRIMLNAKSFGWRLEDSRESLFFLDAQPVADLNHTGSFDLKGMLAILDYKIAEMGAQRVVFDALDMVLRLLPNRADQEQEIYRLHEWLLARKITGLITLKVAGNSFSSDGNAAYGFMHFVVDCAVLLKHVVRSGVSQRTVRILKYRGSAFDENEAPFLIGATGIEVGFVPTQRNGEATTERISSGIAELDTMVSGGFYRRSCVLISGEPGSGKSILGAAFAEAACARGEQAILVSFDSDASEVIRNAKSVGMDLGKWVAQGKLVLKSARSLVSAGIHLVRIKALAKTHRAKCLVVDPVWALAKESGDFNSHSVAELIIDWAKSEGIDLIFTTPGARVGENASGDLLPIMTALADTVIELEHPLEGVRRRRYLSVTKSRGTSHSHVRREIFISSEGIEFAQLEKKRIAKPYKADAQAKRAARTNIIKKSRTAATHITEKSTSRSAQSSASAPKKIGRRQPQKSTTNATPSNKSRLS